MSCQLCESKPGMHPDDLEWDELCEECKYWIKERQQEAKKGDAAE